MDREKRVIDCGDNSCRFATERGGMRTNGGCRCLYNAGFPESTTKAFEEMFRELLDLRDEVSRLEVWSSESHVTDLEAENAQLKDDNQGLRHELKMGHDVGVKVSLENAQLKQVIADWKCDKLEAKELGAAYNETLGKLKVQWKYDVDQLKAQLAEAIGAINAVVSDYDGETDIGFDATVVRLKETLAHIEGQGK